MAEAEIRRDIALGFAWRKEGTAMSQSMIYDKRVLIVDNDPNFFPILERKVREASPNCKVDMAGTYLEAVEKMASSIFDRIILSPVVLQLSNLLQLAQSRNLPMSVLFAATLIHKFGLGFLRSWLKPAFSRKTLDG
jgi:hypothetical protein